MDGSGSLRAFARRQVIILATALYLTLGALLAVPGDLRAGWMPAEQDVPLWGRLLVPAALAALHLARARLPLTMLLCAIVIAVAEFATTGSTGLGTVVFICDFAYAAALYSGAKWLDAAPIVLGVCVVAASLVAADPIVPGSGFVFNLVVLLAVGIWWGRTIRRPRLQVLRERERADAIERVAAGERHDAVLRERMSISRDLHDVVAGHLSAIALQSSAAIERTGEHPERLARSMEAIRVSSLEALAEMRVMIDVLRADSGEKAPGGSEQPGAASLLDYRRAIEVAKDNGLRITESVPGDERLAALPTAVSVTAYRILRECLINVAKHSAGADTSVVITIQDDALHLVIANALTGDSARATAGTSGGLGLIGLRERTRRFGGRIDVERSSRHWATTAVLPLSGRSIGATA